MAIEWEVGDEFIIIDVEKDFLGDLKNGIYTVSHTKYDPDYSLDMNRSDVPCVWFKPNKSDKGHCYATLDNIRKPTPLEKII